MKGKQELIIPSFDYTNYINTKISSLSSTLKSKYWYMVGEFFQMIKMNKPIFNQERFKSSHEKMINSCKKNYWLLIMKSSLNENKSKNEVNNISDNNKNNSSNSSQEDTISLITLKYVYTKVKSIYDDIKKICIKNKLEIEVLLNKVTELTEKYIIENNFVNIYTQEKLIKLVLDFKDFFKEKEIIIKGGYLQKLKNKQLVSKFSKSSLMTGILKNETEKKLNEERLAQAIKDFIKNESYMNLITGKFDYIFEKDTIEIQETKLLEGKLFSLYVLTNQNCLNNKKNLKGGVKLSDIMKKNNSHYFPNDSATSKSKIMNKIKENAISSKLLQEEEIQKIYDKFTLPEANILPLGNINTNSSNKEAMSKKNNDKYELNQQIRYKSVKILKLNDKSSQITNDRKECKSTRKFSGDNKHNFSNTINKNFNHQHYVGLNQKYNTVYTDKKEKSIIDLLDQNKKSKMIPININRKNLEYCYNEKIIQEINSSKRFITENKSNENSVEKDYRNENSFIKIKEDEHSNKKSEKSLKNLRKDYKLKLRNKSGHKVIVKPSISTFVLPVVELQNSHKPELNEAINIYKDKIFSLNRRLDSMSNVEKKKTMNEIDYVLKAIVYKRNHQDDYHKELLKIIKKK